ncbi:hypothetical protein PoB_006772400 [Plakobranchus ocellatus]|uniref:Uncharacterized protein n=1 Tax=Plakobranchus ocellatus TaxID=259542 RepID=A0AAV4DAP2_9GAST|nr:hypothetical protein PoB_006772400 [Plakobranchus ocellatus]
MFLKDSANESLLWVHRVFHGGTYTPIVPPADNGPAEDEDIDDPKRPQHMKLKCHSRMKVWMKNSCMGFIINNNIHILQSIKVILFNTISCGFIIVIHLSFLLTHSI